ncbi:MAG: [Fe-Fe] hydrogenase large subunit C-terminal domain-containing protein [Rikenellaceae bacterium]
MSKGACPISISQSNCDDCFRCVRECDVKAIKFNLNHPQVDSRRCIACGHCIEICPTNIISVESHIERVKRAIKNNTTIIASIAPNWVTEFRELDSTRMIEALSFAGFTHVSETAIGATLVKEKIANIMSESSKFMISNSCPAVTKLIKTSYPSLTEYIANTIHPTVAHAKYLKQVYGKDCIVVAIDSCTATKMFVDEFPDDIYAALTFEELRNFMSEKGVKFDYVLGRESYQFVPFESTQDNQYILPRGVYNHIFLKQYSILNYVIYNFTGLERIQNMLHSLENEEKPQHAFMEFFACTGGCLYGAGAIDSINRITKRVRMSKYEHKEQSYTNGLLKQVDTYQEHIPDYTEQFISESDINSALEELYMNRGDEPINCGGCGYESCLSFAKALSKGMTRADMCFYYQKQLAQVKFNTLLSNMNSGVAVVGADLKIVEANKFFAAQFGEHSKMIFETHPGMRGIAIDRIAHFSEFIKNVIEQPTTAIEKDFMINEKILNVNIFPIQKGKLVCVIVRNIFSSGVKNSEIVTRARQVINDNLEMVQKIAYLLGDNASKTEAVLNSIIESQK